jgi:hypothetical protein
MSAGRSGHLSPLAGRGRIALAIRVRGALRKGGRDGLKNARHISKHIVVPEPQHSVVATEEPFVTNRISSAVGVLASIQFNDKTTFAADQINCVRTDRLLPDRLVTIEAPRSESIPQGFLRARGVPAQASGTLGFDLVGTSQAETPPHPDCCAIRPLPARGERLALA